MLPVEAEGVHRALQSGDVTVVVGAPDVDDPVKAAHRELVAVIGDVGGEVGIKAVGAAQHVVLQSELFDVLRLFARRQQLVREDAGGGEPEGAVALIGIAQLLKLRHGVRDVSGIM